MYVCKSGNSYRAISALQNTSSWKGPIRIIKSKRLLLEGPYKTEPHSEGSFRTPRTLAVLVPCAVADHGHSEESFISIPSELPLTQFHASALCLAAGPYREKTSAYLLPALKRHGWWWGHPSAPSPRGTKQVTPATPHVSGPQSLSLSQSLLSGHAQGLWCPSRNKAPLHST